MKNHLLVMLGACLIGTITTGANAQFTYSVDFLGDRALTTDNNFGQPGTPGWHWGWDNFETPFDDRSEDATLGTSYPATGGALKLLDQDGLGFKSSHLAYDVGERQDGTGAVTLKAGGVVVARVKNNGTLGAGVGFGYSSSDGNHTGVLGIENNAVSITGWDTTVGPIEYDTNGGAAGNDTAVPGGNLGAYRTYALTWSVDFLNQPAGFNHTRYDVWVLNSSVPGPFSNNQADWIPLITDLQPRSTTVGNNQVMPDVNAIDGVATGVMIGSFGPGPGGFGRTASGDLDFDCLSMRANTPGNYNDGAHPNFMATITPWSLDYSGLACAVPEPGTLLLAGLAGLGLFRRRPRV